MKYLYCLAVLLCTGCSEKDSLLEKSISIEWDQSSMVCISERGVYARMKKLSDGRLMSVYTDENGNGALRSSDDDGATWSSPRVVASAFSVEDKNSNSIKVEIANAELIELSNGDMLFGCNLRPAKDNVFPFTIAISKSTDKGQSWSALDRIYSAGKKFTNGCWEPIFLELPDGNVQVYFANEAPYIYSTEQEISVMESSNSGDSWGEARRVCFRARSRDGMPVPLIYGDSIYLAIEDNGKDQFKPFIVKTSIVDNWKEPVLLDSQDRYMPLAVGLPDNIYAGAPFIIRTQNYSILSYQTTRERTDNWEKSTMEVVVSKSIFRDMRGATQPFSVPLGCSALWGCLTHIGGDKVAAVTSTNFKGGQGGIWIIKGEVVE